jgi:hypothetical protein
MAEAEQPSPNVEEVPSKPSRTLNLLIMDGDETHDWVSMFKGFRLSDHSAIHVYQASWMEMTITTYKETGCIVCVAPIRESSGNIKRPRTANFTPHLVLVRNQVRGPYPSQDKKNLLFGLMYADVPAINSLTSLYQDLERSVMFAELAKIERRLGHDKFPLIDQTYYGSASDMVIAPSFPCVVKVSHAHAGMGKIQIKDSTEFRDISTVLALHSDYATAEPYIEPEWGLRVQKIGPHYRVMKKIMTGSGWKSHFGGSMLTEIELTPEYKLWADECSKMYGGMDLLAVDAIRGKDGKDYIIEVNGSAIGLLAERWVEDSEYVRDLVLEKLESHYVKSQESQESKEDVPATDGGSVPAGARVYRVVEKKDVPTPNGPKSPTWWPFGNAGN